MKHYLKTRKMINVIINIFAYVYFVCKRHLLIKSVLVTSCEK